MATKRKKLPSLKVSPGQLLIGTGFLLLGAAAIFLVRSTVGSPHNETSGDDIFSQSKKDLKDLERQGISPTLSQTALESLANQIHNAIRYSAVADDKGRAEALLKTRPKNQADVLALIRAYGDRQLHMFGFPDGGKKDLPTAIGEELSRTQLSRINQVYQSKGITFRF